MFPGALFTIHEDGTARSGIALSGTETVPLGGIANVVTVFCNENGTYTIYESNEQGFLSPLSPVTKLAGRTTGLKSRTGTERFCTITFQGIIRTA